MLGIGWDIRDGYGWGVFGLHLLLELIRTGKGVSALGQVSIEGLDEDELALALEWAHGYNRPAPGKLAYPVLHPLGDGLRGLPPSYEGSTDWGVVFLCDTDLDTREAQANLRRYDGFLAGCQWNRTLLFEAGARHVACTPQGVNTQVFYPRPSSGQFQHRFVVYSGGKLEFRKGQDQVVAAFRAFHARHPEALLVTTWQSPWPVLAQSLSASSLVTSIPETGADGLLNLDAWLLQQGLPEGSFINYGTYPNRFMPKLLCECHVALLPSRAEGGTNLVAMEALASGLPVILSNNTGHRDLIETVPCLSLERQDPVAISEHGTRGWGASDIDEMVEAMERVYTNWDQHHQQGLAAAEVMAKLWSWQPCMRKLIEVVDQFELHEDGPRRDRSPLGRSAG